MTALILPGQEFEIEVQGLKFMVKALAGKQQVELIKTIKKCSELEENGEQVSAMEATVSVLACIFGKEQAGKYWEETVDTEMAHEIATKVLQRGKLSEDDSKNLPSPHSLCAANYASDAGESASETSTTAAC